MAEAIGLVASVVQLAGTGLKLSQALYQYADGVANADRRIKEVAKEIKLTSCVIEELGNVFKEDDTLRLISKSAVATANETLKECSELFGEIETILNKSKKGKMGRFILPFRENKMELLRNHIDKLKSTLQLLMQVLLHAHQVASNKIDREAEARQRDEIRQLLEEKKNTTKKYEESLRTFVASDSSTEVEDDTFSLDEKGSASTVDIKAIGSTMDPDSLAECMQHIRTLLESMERLQQALASKSEGDDHSNHHQTAIESYFVARSYLDSTLLGSSNTINVTGTELRMQELTSSKTSITASDSKSLAVKKKKEQGSLVIEMSEPNDETTTRKEIVPSYVQDRNSRKKTVPEQVSTGPGPPPGIRETAYGRTRTDIRSSPLSKPRCSNRSSESGSCPRPIAPGFSLPSASPPAIETVIYESALVDYKRGKNFIPRPFNDPAGNIRSQSASVAIHGPVFDMSGERKEHTHIGNENDVLEAAPEGNDEVDELLREWTTCFS